MNGNDFELNGKKVTEDKDFAEVNNVNKAMENVSSGEKADSTVVFEKIQGDKAQEKTAAAEAVSAGVSYNKNTVPVNSAVWNRNNAGAQGMGGMGQNRYSASYAPPHYVPNFTVASTDPRANARKESRRNGASVGLGIGAIVISVTVAVVISLTLGGIAGAFMGSISGAAGSSSSDGVINIITSDREISVVEIPGNTGYSDLTVAQVAALVGESVVEITTAEAQYYGQYVTSGAGSGVIFDFKSDTGNGYIVTNYHVVDGADKIIVRVKSGDGHSEYVAEYVAGDEGADIAVLKIVVTDGKTLRPAVFVSDSDKLTVGEEVVAIGNPLGSLGGTVTNGIISALDREITVGDHNMTLLQTNAAINPGNSGGGLFNMAGELVGIVNAKQASTGIEGLGFAIPANKVRSDINDIITVGYITGRKTLGIDVQYGQYNYGSGWFGSSSVTGVIVVDAGSTSFKYGDCITRIGNKEITSALEYNTYVDSLSIGEQVTVQVLRSGKTMTVTATVKEDTSK